MTTNVANAFHNIRVLAERGVPNFVVQDILSLYPIDQRCQAFARIEDKYVRLWSAEMPVEVVDFDGLSALISLSLYQLSGDATHRRAVVRRLAR